MNNNNNIFSDKNYPEDFKPDFENFSDKDLYSYCKKVGFNARVWSRKFMAALPEVSKRRLYKKYGYCSIHEFAAKMAGISRDNVDEVLRVSDKFKELPKMKALIGEVGLSKLRVVACVVNKENEKDISEKVKNFTKASLEIYVREIKLKELNKKNGNINFHNSNSDIEPLTQQGRIVAFLPGEANMEIHQIPRLQRQIDMFDSENFRSHNYNSARLESPQKHDKRIFTIQIDDETEFELRKFKQQLEKARKEPIDWNSALKEMVKKASNEKKVQ